MSAVLRFPAEARRQRIRTLRESLIDLEALKADIERENDTLFRTYRETVIRLAEVAAELAELTGRAS